MKKLIIEESDFMYLSYSEAQAGRKMAIISNKRCGLATSARIGLRFGNIAVQQSCANIANTVTDSFLKDFYE